MKTRIFTSSSSGINYIKSKNNICVLPNIISYGDESYYDLTEIDPDRFYARKQFDSEKAHINAVDRDKFEEIIERNKRLKYDNFIFIFNEYETDYFKLLDRYKNENFIVIKTKLYLYPLIHCLIEIDKMVKKEFDLDAIKAFITNSESNFKIYFYVPNKDLSRIITADPKYDPVARAFKEEKGILYDGTKDGLMLLKKYKNKHAYEYMIKAILQEMKDYNTIPFILYSSNINSLFVDVALEKIKPNHKNTGLYPLSIEFGNELGIGAIAVGFIIE